MEHLLPHTKNTQVGIPSPNPSYPSPVNVVKGDNEVVVGNKNCIDISKLLGSKSGVTATSNNGYIHLSGTPTGTNRPITVDYYITDIVKRLSTATISWNVASGTYNHKVRIYRADENGTILNRYETNPCTLQYEEGYSYWLACFVGSSDTLINLNCDLAMQIEQGSTATSYVPHAEQVYPISLGSIELVKIGNYQDKLFKAINGDVVYDSLTSTQKEGLNSGKWYKYGAISKVMLNGTETWVYDSQYNYFRCPSYNFGEKIPVSITSATRPTYKQYCNLFTLNTSWSGTGSFRDTTDKSMFYPLQNEGYKVLFRNTDYTTTNDFATWLSNNNVIVYYPLATPTFTEITDTTLITQLENWRNSKSYQGQTNISQTNDDKAFVISYTTLKDVYSELDSRLKALEG